MKRIILFFAVCLGLSVSQTTFADDAETVRAASKRTSGTTITTNTNSNRSVASNTKRTESNQSKNSRTAVTPIQQRNVTGRTPVASQQNVKTRTAVQQPKAESKQISNRQISIKSRGAVNRTIETRKNETVTKNSARSATTKKTKHTARAAELNSEKIENIKSKNYSKCKTVYFECMDEFCANKDTNLRRCACSSRIHEFDNIKKQLSDAEDKMSDFNQRLLTVSLEKEDAAAINVASEGELAFQTKDRSESEKLLQKITNTLNNSGDSRLNNDLSAISLSLDMDTAWDSIDSMGGISTSAKEGLELYNAASPVCIEMAQEVCSEEELNIAQGSYKLTIQQDCNTVAKSYETLYNQAQAKIHESGALLDMSRLNIYQQRNSDDILTCKKKILTQLSDASVCGENLYKCLDTTGQYINPSTGKAVLTTELYNLSSLIKEPTGNEKWSKVTQNEKFVNFLNSKKEFLEPAIEQCQDIADLVWKDFLDDALSQIKLAQKAKMEEIRQSCTTLITECKSASLSDLSEFDARALSTFSVIADTTSNSMCKNIETSCIALMDGIDSSGLWKTGIAGISTDISYDNILETCTQIGRDCIVQQCNGTSGNFALCKKTTDNKRADILSRNACWNDVYNCVKQADNIDNMTTGILSGRENYYKSLYAFTEPATYSDVPDFCGENDKACLITEQIWGNCEYNPKEYDITTNSQLDQYKTHNKILLPTNGSTLLSWLATNTSSSDANDSCNARGCPINYHMNENGQCTEIMADCVTTTDHGECVTNNNQIINVTSGVTNYCESGVLDVFGNCCANNTEKSDDGICVPSEYKSSFLQTITCDGTESNDPDGKYLCPTTLTSTTKRKISVYCAYDPNGNNQTSSATPGLTYIDSGDLEFHCNAGFWLLIDQHGNYFNIQDQTSGDGFKKVNMSYNTSSTNTCKYEYTNSTGWKFSGNDCSGVTTPIPQDNEFLISY